MRIAPTEAGVPTVRRAKQGEIRVARTRRHPAHDQNPRRMGVEFLRTPAAVPPC